MERKRPQGYRYHGVSAGGKINQLIGLGFLIFGIWTAMSSVVLLFAELPGEISSPSRAAIFALETLFGAVLLSGLFIAMGLVVTHQAADVGTGASGLVVQVYIAFWQRIPWDAVEAVEQLWPAQEHRYQQAIILVHRLTIWHRLLTASHGRGFSPGILVTRDHRQWRELVQVVSRHVLDRTLVREA